MQNASPRAVSTPIIDLLSVGLLSIIGITFYLAFLAPYSPKESLPWIITLATVINGAHFLASYRILYSSREQILRYKSASIYIPIFLILYQIWALYRINIDSTDTIWIQSLLIVTALYLALHYTGQAWGMMCSMGFVKNIFFDAKEKSLFKFSLKLLVIWQIVWSLNLLPQWHNQLEEHRHTIVQLSYVFLVVALFLGIYSFKNLKNRINKSIPLSMLCPYFALFFWYALIGIYPMFLMGVQISHAIQYLIFPLRVEANRYAQEKSSVVGHLLQYLLILALISTLLFVFFPEYMKDGYAVYSQVLISCINIHHFYIDGCIWKITNPIVKEELFAHLKK
jgi:hypothetical protein